MSKLSITKEYIDVVLQTSRFAVLATEGNGQPHASLIAITPFGNSRHLIFSTYRNTLKYRNLSNNSKVAVLIEGAYVSMKGFKESVVITIIGNTEDINAEGNEAAYQAHLKRHPEMKSFILSSDCALIMLTAQSYQVVKGVEDISWITAEDLDLT